jgi:hypothetical protein
VNSLQSIHAAYRSFENSTKVVFHLLIEFSANLAPIKRYTKDVLDPSESKMARVRRQPEDAGEITKECDALFAFVEWPNVRANTLCETFHPISGRTDRAAMELFRFQKRSAIWQWSLGKVDISIQSQQVDYPLPLEPRTTYE